MLYVSAYVCGFLLSLTSHPPLFLVPFTKASSLVRFLAACMVIMAAFFNVHTVLFLANSSFNSAEIWALHIVVFVLLNLPPFDFFVLRNSCFGDFKEEMTWR